MREIRLRAWDGERMHTFDNFTEILDYCDISGWNVRPNDPDYKGEWICGESQSKKPFDLMQYTGLKDKNGKDIYEGDILRTESAGFGVVVWWSDHGYWAINLFSIPGDPRILYTYAIYGGEVIGNIHQNPDLMPE